MDFLYEKISYLRGLADGLDVKPDSKEGKLFNALMDVIEEIADGMNDIVEEQDEVNEYLDLMDVIEEIADGMNDIVEEQDEVNEYLDLLDEDLSTVEEELFGDLEIDEDDDYDFDFDDEFDDEFDDDYDDDFEEHECNCAEHEDI